MPKYDLNPFTGKFDKTGQTTDDVVTNNTLYLKLDQTTHQHVISGTPVFDEGISILAGKKLILDGG